MLLILLGTIALNCVTWWCASPKDFFPEQDTGRLNGSIQADQDTSFQSMDKMLLQFENIIDTDPAVDAVMVFTGGGRGGATNRRAHVHFAQAAQRAQIDRH